MLVNLSLPGVLCSPLGFKGCVSGVDGGAVAAFEDEGGAQVRVRRVFAADFCDLFGSQVALGERPQGDRAGHLGHVHAVCVGELARGFDPRAHDAAAVVLLVVLVVAVGEVVSINGERLVVGGSGGTSWEDGRSVDGDMCAVGEGDGVVGRVLGVFLVMLVARVRACGRVVIRCWGSETARAWGKHVEGRRLINGLRPFPRVRPRVYPRAPGCLLVGEPDCGVGGGGFAVDDSAVAVFDGEAVVCGASAVDAGVEGDGCGVVGCGGVEGDDGGFAPAAPDGAVVCGFVLACALVLACARLFDHGLWRACVSGLFAGVLCASVGDPCVCDGSEGLAGAQGDGGGVSACCAVVVAFVIVQGCVDGDNVVVLSLARARVRVVCAVARECENAVCGGHNGFTDQHVGERLLFALDPRVDLLLGECYADGGERLALVAWGGEGAGGDVRVSGADGGGHGFALVEEDERHARDGARVVGVGVEVCALDDAAVCVCAHVLAVCACARAGTVLARVAVA